MRSQAAVRKRLEKRSGGQWLAVLSTLSSTWDVLASLCLNLLHLKLLQRLALHVTEAFNWIQRSASVVRRRLGSSRRPRRAHAV